MKKIIVGSNNPVKIKATKESFKQAFNDSDFECITFSAKSGVPDQPFGVVETKTGAKNRSDACRSEYLDADFFIGLEGGLEKFESQYWAFAWMCVQDKDGKYGFGRTGSFLLPPQVSKLIDDGQELGIATDSVFNETNSKQKRGTVGVLTNDTINRQSFYRDAIILALIPFLKPDLYK